MTNFKSGTIVSRSNKNLSDYSTSDESTLTTRINSMASTIEADNQSYKRVQALHNNYLEDKDANPKKEHRTTFFRKRWQFGVLFHGNQNTMINKVCEVLRMLDIVILFIF